MTSTQTKNENITENNIAISTEPKWKSSWRPAIGWAYVLIIVFDFMVAPVLTGVMYTFEQHMAIQQVYYLDKNGATKEEITQMTKAIPASVEYKVWQPLTLQANGIFHIFMAAILSVGSYGRSKEKIERLKNGIFLE